MANVRNYIQINPIDNKKNTSIGVRFPFNAEGVFHPTYTTKEQVKNNLLNILLTEPGERIHQPNFGVGLKQLLFENNVDINDLQGRIANQVSKYLPIITIIENPITQPPNGHTIFITIKYQITQTSETDAIQMNFNSSPTQSGGNAY